MKSAKEGGDSVLYAALSSDLEGAGGLYLENSRPHTPSSFVRDPEVQAKTWHVTCNMLNVREFGVAARKA
jgi:hypothetical protein